MRDYSFGNFLHELRVRRGLSQFQLGMLVGVSNKAVSKWENGLAKPGSRILYKLSEVLGITIDELLTCKFRPAENKNIKGAYAMKKALWKKAGESLKNLYGDVPPMEAADRYFSEYAELKDTDQIIFFELLGRMEERIRRKGGHMRVNSGIGASFVAFLMGASKINPLRPHYYCPGCHEIRFAEGYACGWDLPVKKCSCGGELVRDGHALSFETLRPLIRKAANYAVSVPQNLYRTAQEVIFDFFQGNKIVELTKKKPGIKTYVILDAETPDITEGQELSYDYDENYDRFKQYPAVTLIQDEEMDVWGRLEKETGISFENVPFTDKRVFDAFADGATRGIPEFGSDFARNIIAQSAPACIHDLVQIPGLCHGTGVWKGNGELSVKAGRSIGSLIAYRDDVFQCIQGKMRPGSGTGYASHVMEDVRRGVYAREGMPEEIRRQLLELGLEEWVIESFGKIGYLFPKALGIWHVKYAMTLMWYRIYYPDILKNHGCY